MQASIIEMSNQERQSSSTLEGMFRLRHEVFKERLKWDVGSGIRRDWENPGGREFLKTKGPRDTPIFIG